MGTSRFAGAPVPEVTPSGELIIRASPRAGSGEIAVLIQNRPYLGALLVHLPLLHALRRVHPGHRIVAYSPFGAARLLADERAVDDVVHYRGLIPLWRALRAQKPDRIISLRRKSLRVGLAVVASGAPRSIGFRHGMNTSFLRHAVPLDKRVYRALAFLRVMDLPPDVAREQIAACVRELASRSAWKPDANARYYCVIPCGSDGRKQWGLTNFLDYCRAWRARDACARFIFVLGPRERAMAGAVADSDLASRSLTLVEPALATIARVVLASRVTVTNDCAPGHVAQMSGAACVSVFGNWDGASDRRVGEWFFERPGSRCVVPGASRRADGIPVSAVFEASVGVAREHWAS